MSLMSGIEDSLSEATSANTTTKIISSGIFGHYKYPYRMLKEKEARPSVRENCIELYIDSGFNNPEVTNTDVLEKAKKYNGDFVIPKDYIGKPDETVEMMKQFFDVYHDFNCNAKPYVVVQPPFEDTVLRHEEFYSQFGRIALGGLRDSNPRYQVGEIKGFWKAVEQSERMNATSLTVHGFGVGLSPRMALFLREHQHGLSSLDVSTPEQAAANGAIPDMNWVQQKLSLIPGDNRSQQQALYATTALLNMNRALIPDENETVDNISGINEGELYKMLDVDTSGETEQSTLVATGD